MSFAVVCIIALIALGIIAALVSHLQGGDDEVTVGHDCSTCTSADDGSCQLHCLMEEKRKRTCADSRTL
jgi:hypothetical protein